MSRFPYVKILDVRDDKELEAAPKIKFPRGQYAFVPIVFDIGNGPEPNREFAPRVKEFLRKEKDTCVVLIACKDGKQKSAVAFNKVLEMGFEKVRATPIIGRHQLLAFIGAGIIAQG